MQGVSVARSADDGGLPLPTCPSEVVALGGFVQLAEHLLAADAHCGRRRVLSIVNGRERGRRTTEAR